MTEKNIDHLITAIYGLGTFLAVYYYWFKLLTKGNQPDKIQQVVTTKPDRDKWDKMKILTAVIASLAALIVAIAQLTKLFVSKG